MTVGRHHHRDLCPGSVDGAPSWSPDGAAIAFDGTSPSGYTEIFTVASDGSGTPVQVTVSGAHSFVFAAQPDWQRRGH